MHENTTKIVSVFLHLNIHIHFCKKWNRWCFNSIGAHQNA